MSDGTTTTGARCEGCGEMGVMTCFECMRQEDDGIRAENARLRERVAALEGLLQAMTSAHCDPKCQRVGHFKLCYQARAALAQAGDGGAA